MPVSVTKQPTGTNFINNCSVWELNITGTIDETKDQRGLYRLMSDDGAVTDWVSLPPVGSIAVNFSKAIAGALTTPIPGFSGYSMDASDMKKQFWLEYGDVEYDKENCTKTENLGNTTSPVDFINGVLNGGQSANFIDYESNGAFTMRPDYIEVPRNWYFDWIYSTAGSANFSIKLCTGQIVNSSIGSAGEITAFGVGTSNSPVSTYLKDVVYYDVTIQGVTYRFRVIDAESRGVNEWGFTGNISKSQRRFTQICFLEPSGGYSGVPCEIVEDIGQEIAFEEVCVYDSGCYGEPDYSRNQGTSIFNKRAKARYSFAIKSPRTQQFGVWMQHLAGSGKYLLLFRSNSGAFYWSNFMVDSISNGYNWNEDYIVVSGYLAHGISPQGS